MEMAGESHVSFPPGSEWPMAPKAIEFEDNKIGRFQQAVGGVATGPWQQALRTQECSHLLAGQEGNFIRLDSWGIWITSVIRLEKECSPLL